jgi:hypothetical protein
MTSHYFLLRDLLNEYDNLTSVRVSKNVVFVNFYQKTVNSSMLGNKYVCEMKNKVNFLHSRH